MRPRVAIIYNEPGPSRYQEMGENTAILGVLDEVNAVEQALSDSGYPVFRHSLVPPLEQVKTELSELEADVIFNLFEGFDGNPETEATVARFLTELRWRFTGCPASSLALALDKAKTKDILKLASVKTPRYQLLTSFNLSSFSLRFPCIVKPCGEDASHGLSEESMVNDMASLKKQVIRVGESFGGLALVEEFLDGREFNITVMGNDEPMVMPISEIVYTLPADKPRILTFAAKWQSGDLYFSNTSAVCPADIDQGLRNQINETAITAFKLIGCRGYARVDLRLDSEGVPNVLEVNPNPDISPDTGAARQAVASGMTYNFFIEKILNFALEQVCK